MELGGKGGAHGAAKIRDQGRFFKISSVICPGRGEGPDSGQEVKCLWARERTAGRQGCEVQEVAVLLFMSPVASENILYHVHSWLSTNSKAIFYYRSEPHFQSR